MTPSTVLLKNWFYSRNDGQQNSWDLSTLGDSWDSFQYQNVMLISPWFYEITILKQTFLLNLSGIVDISSGNSHISEVDFLKKSLWVESKFEADSLKWSYGSNCTEIITERRHHGEGSPHKYFLVAARS